MAKNSDGFDGISHGYAPEGSANDEAPVPLNDLVRNLLDNANATAKAELALLKARGDLAKQGAATTSIWGAAAAIMALVALLSFAGGMILTLATLVGPLAATAIVVLFFAVIAALAAVKAKAGVSDVKIAFRRNLFGEGDAE